MTIITAKRKKRFFILTIMAVLPFWGVATGILLLFAFIEDRSSNYQMLGYSAVLYAVGIFFLKSYFKNAPQIIVGDQFIRINSKVFAWTDLKEIELTGKKSYSTFFDFPREATTLIFNNRDRKYLFDGMYKNSAEIKLFLKQLLIDKKTTLQKEYTPVTTDELVNDSYETFTGNPYTSWPGLLFAGLVAIGVINNANQKTSYIMWCVYVLILLYTFLMFSYRNNYFQVSRNYFVIKNKVFFWKTKAYRTKEIEEIVIEKWTTKIHGIRVIAKDFTAKYYPVNYLKSETWLQLKDCLKEHHIPIRDA